MSEDTPDVAWFLFEEDGEFDSFIRGRKALNYDFEYSTGTLDGMPAVFERAQIESGQPKVIRYFFAHEDLGYFWAVCIVQRASLEVCENLLASITISEQ